MTNSNLPRHIAIIMDGNGRWAKQRFLPRIIGHRAGVEAARRVIKYCVEKKIEVLTLWAFGSENWRRPHQEVSFLLDLLLTALQRETEKLHKQNVQLRMMGERSRFDERLRQHIIQSEQLTANNTGMKLVIAADYGGQWDISCAVRAIAAEIESGTLKSADVTPNLIATKLSMADLPNPDILIRTSGEQRVSNFMLWQLAYTELYFPNVYWPDFNAQELEKALQFYNGRERRYGHTSEQLSDAHA